MAAKELEFAQADARLNQHINAARTFNRRNFMAGLGVAGAAVAGAGVLSGCGNGGASVVSAATPEADVLNFALNLEYFEATFYSFLVTGADLDPSITGGGTVVGAPAKLTGLTPILADFLAEIYYDEISHVKDLRLALGPAAVVRPNLALAAITAGNYVSAARLAEDVGVTAYSGAVTLLTGSNLQAASQILAVEGFHAGALRYIAVSGVTGSAAAYPGNLPDPADGYDIKPTDPGAAIASTGPTKTGGAFFATAGNTSGNSGTTAQTNTFPGFAYRRTTSQVLAILYGSATAGTTSGGFFPNGLNGNIKTV